MCHANYFILPQNLINFSRSKFIIQLHCGKVGKFTWLVLYKVKIVIISYSFLVYSTFRPLRVIKRIFILMHSNSGKLYMFLLWSGNDLMTKFWVSQDFFFGKQCLNRNLLRKILATFIGTFEQFFLQKFITASNYQPRRENNKKKM